MNFKKVCAFLFACIYAMLTTVHVIIYLFFVIIVLFHCSTNLLSLNFLVCSFVQEASKYFGDFFGGVKIDQKFK